MRPDQKPTYYQVKLTLTGKVLWDQLPEPQRVRCRQLLIQLLRTVVLQTPLPTPNPEPDHE
jgi:hypothetical protein